MQEKLRNQDNGIFHHKLSQSSLSSTISSSSSGNFTQSKSIYDTLVGSSQNISDDSRLKTDKELEYLDLNSLNNIINNKLESEIFDIVNTASESSTSLPDCSPLSLNSEKNLTCSALLKLKKKSDNLFKTKSDYKEDSVSHLLGDKNCDWCKLEKPDQRFYLLGCFHKSCSDCFKKQLENSHQTTDLKNPNCLSMRIDCSACEETTIIRNIEVFKLHIMQQIFCSTRTLPQKI